MAQVTLAPSSLSMVRELKFACAIWGTLERRFTIINQSTILALKMEFHAITKNNDSIEVFMNWIKDSRDKLAEIDVHIDDEEFLGVVLKGLPNEFHSSITTFLKCGYR